MLSQSPSLCNIGKFNAAPAAGKEPQELLPKAAS